MKISISNIEATENQITFNVTSENVQNISYMVLKEAVSEPNPKYVLISGVKISPNASEIVTVDDLLSNSGYVIYVAAGNQGRYIMEQASVSTEGEEIQEPGQVVTVTYRSLLEEMISFDAQTRFPAISYMSRQASSYDRRSVSPDAAHWCANDDGWGYERMEYRSGRQEKVIFDEKHPGVISRIWLTSFGSPQTIVRFYLDGSTEPTWQINTFDLNDFASDSGVDIGTSLVFPDAEWIRGSSLYLPISYGKSCKITIEELVEPITVSRYYHINFRRYPDNVAVETLTPEILAKNSSMISVVNEELTTPTISVGEDCKSSAVIDANGSWTIDMPQGTNSINQLEIEVSAENPSDLQAAISNINITGVFDGHKTFELPLQELAGAGEGAYYLKSWRFSVNGRGKFVLRWQMPYRSTASITLSNKYRKAVSVNVASTVASYVWDERSLYFHAAYRKEDGVRLTHFSNYSSCIDWKFGHIVGGRGVLVGDVYTINNPYSEWPGEGDEKIWVDDESFPSHFGTGVEDYYSFCGYFRFHTPFGGEPRLDATNFKGYNIHYRTRNLDAIPFNNKLRFDLEMLGWANGNVDVASTIFWYGDAQTISQ